MPRRNAVMDWHLPAVMAFQWTNLRLLIISNYLLIKGMLSGNRIMVFAFRMGMGFRWTDLRVLIILNSLLIRGMRLVNTITHCAWRTKSASDEIMQKRCDISSFRLIRGT
jgi:hypothetical protein